MARRVSANRKSRNDKVTTQRVRASNGTFAKVYRGNYSNSRAMKAAHQTASRFGTRDQKRRDLRAAFGLSSG